MMAATTKDKKAANPTGKSCSNCLAPEGSSSAPKLSACARCGLVAYCSRDCQKAHWKANHKQHCVAKAERAPQIQNLLDAPKGNVNEAAASGLECSICLDPLAESSIMTLPCKHVFHGACVVELKKFGVSQACPLCRTPLTPGPDMIFDEATRRFMVVHQLVERGYATWSTLPALAKYDIKTAIEGWHAAADAGLMYAQFNLGILYSNGNAVPQDDEKAAKWYRKAAEQGMKAAQRDFGNLLHDGRGVEQSDMEAASWHRKAADQGDKYSQSYLGVMYREGRGVAQSDKDAAYWFKMAAEQGCCAAQSNLGRMFSEGQGVKQSDVEALRWHRMAAEQGNADAQCDMGDLLQAGRGAAQSNQQAAVWYLKAATQGHASSQCKLGYLFEKGHGVAKSYVKAVQ